MKKSLSEFMSTPFLGGPADDAIILSSGPPPDGHLLYWKYGTNLEYKEYLGKKIRVSLHKGIVQSARRVRNQYHLKMDGPTHIYVYCISEDLYVYAGLYPVSNPLNIQIKGD